MFAILCFLEEGIKRLKDESSQFSIFNFHLPLIADTADRFPPVHIGSHVECEEAVIVGVESPFKGEVEIIFIGSSRPKEGVETSAQKNETIYIVIVINTCRQSPETCGIVG